MVADPVPRSGAQRVFFALWPDAPTAAALDRLAVDVAAAAQGRAATRERLHLTVAFIGEVDAARITQLAAMGADTAARAAPFIFALDHLGYFRDAGVAWIGTRATPEPLLSLVRDLQTSLASAAFPVDARPYQPHLTLARRCRRRPAGIAVPALAWHAHAMTLHASRLSREGPAYKELGRWAFGPDPAPA